MFTVALSTYRNKNGLSQEDMVNFLVRLDKSLESLDRVTYSRWERGITNPSLDKKYIILKSLFLFDALFKELEAGNESDKREQDLVINKRFTSSTLGVDNLYCRKKTVIFYIVTKELSLEEYEFFSKYGEKIYDHRLTFEDAKIFNKNAKKNYHYTFYDERDLLIGHVFFHITDKGNISTIEKDLEKSLLINENDKLLFVGNVYSTSKRITLIHFYLVKELLISNVDVSGVYTQVFHDSVLRFYLLLGGKVVNTSVTSEDGVFYKKRSYKWLGVLVPADCFIKFNALTPIEAPSYLKESNKQHHILCCVD